MIETGGDQSATPIRSALHGPATRRFWNRKPDAFDVKKLPVFDDWPEKVPITEEIDIFERNFGDPPVRQ